VVDRQLEADLARRRGRFDVARFAELVVLDQRAANR